MNRKERRGSAQQAQRVVITTDEHAHFIRQELGGYRNAFVLGDLRAMVVCQYWADGECMNAWHIETDEQRAAIIAKLREMIAHLERPFATED
jgi:hypothetical protein